ncbi:MULTISPECIES: hypothetical protein [Bacteria]|uniref:hypothetical protein n=1 Tax=Pseudomonadati TaxID=3379134 RepID=UPI00260264E0|nr:MULTISPECIES: hypothetical protein [Bacteria]
MEKNTQSANHSKNESNDLDNSMPNQQQRFVSLSYEDPRYNRTCSSTEMHTSEINSTNNNNEPVTKSYIDNLLKDTVNTINYSIAKKVNFIDHKIDSFITSINQEIFPFKRSVEQKLFDLDTKIEKKLYEQNQKMEYMFHEQNQRIERVAYEQNQKIDSIVHLIKGDFALMKNLMEDLASGHSNNPKKNYERYSMPEYKYDEDIPKPDFDTTEE